MAKTAKPKKKTSSKTSKTKAKAKKSKAPKKAAKPRKAVSRKKPATRPARRKKAAKKPVRKTAKKLLKKSPKKAAKKKVTKAKAKPKTVKARKPTAKKSAAKPKAAKPKVAKPKAAPKPKPAPATKPMAIPPPRPIPPAPRAVAPAPAPAPMPAPAAPPVKELKVGDMAPDLRLPADNDQMISLADFRGKKVVLFFYPKDDTPGCTMEACSFRDGLEAIRAKGAVVLGVSIDPVLSHQRFRDKYNLNFPLLSDRDKKTVEAFGVWKERSMYGQTFMGTERTTFIIDENGRIAKIFPKVKVEGHYEEVLNSL